MTVQIPNFIFVNIYFSSQKCNNKRETNTEIRE